MKIKFHNFRIYDASEFASLDEALRFAKFWGAEVYQSYFNGLTVEYFKLPG